MASVAFPSPRSVTPRSLPDILNRLSLRFLNDPFFARTVTPSATTISWPETRRKIGEKVLSKEVQTLVDEETNTSSLTDRQLQQLELAARGFSNQEIADQLNVSLITVKKQFSNIFVRLNVSNRSEAVSFALQRHLIMK